ncbi:TetR family transcriptional regulator C-terminal domain-containing protein [Saccharopolyspora sp. TS4A08]|uniref:TetR family transcriptional regulator C-terminal domain-containing protein n=1 Tax=Saccharopolyspora ipomoeae TaxID=3042027 RepID=A0ABT6PHM1_9PSEU|nr:TetR family transcriptional regulator C-terminal domain-containing protein [Saccharopolyspora sp. TS4A08]MDI2026996.1 TetR family transcriptional regulator C-terminal domain-containing protein [Saccharopolyspora sp. TS4A08]
MNAPCSVHQAPSCQCCHARAEQADLHPAREWFTTRYDNVRTMIADELRKGVAHGDVRPEADCDAIAAEIVATIDGLQLQWLLAPEKVDMPALFRAYAARLRAALKP